MWGTIRPSEAWFLKFNPSDLKVQAKEHPSWWAENIWICGFAGFMGLRPNTNSTTITRKVECEPSKNFWMINSDGKDPNDRKMDTTSIEWQAIEKSE